MVIPLNIEDLYNRNKPKPTPEQVDFARGVLADLLSIERRARNEPGFQQLANVCAGVRLAAIRQRLPQAAFMLASLGNCARITDDFRESFENLVDAGLQPDEIRVEDVVALQRNGASLAGAAPDLTPSNPEAIDPRLRRSPYIDLVTVALDPGDVDTM